jgi:photosystem II stability/assembly factor-like uncharacterized protein
MARALALAVSLCGAAALAQTWRPLGPEGGEVTTIAVDPRSAMRIFAGVRGGFAYRSDDNGGTWANFSTGLGGTELPVIVPDPNAANTWWAGTNSGLFRTTDNGASWTLIPTGLSGPAASLVALALDKSSPSTIYAGSNVATVGQNTSIVIGLDGGASWSPSMLPTMATPSTIALDPNGVLYVGTSFVGGGVFRSPDRGQTWSPMSMGLGTSIVDSITIDPAVPTRLFAGTAVGLYVSSDSAATWNEVDGGLPAGRGPVVFSSNAIYAAVGPQIFKSSDNGGTWAAASNGLSPRPVLSLSNNNNKLSAGTAGPGVFTSGNGGNTWTAGNTGLRGSIIRAVASVPGHLWVGTHANGAAHSVDRGATWAQSDAGVDVEVMLIDPATPATVYALADRKLVKSTNTGATWSEQSNGLDSGVDLLALAGSMPSRLYAGACFNNVFRSDNGGASWAPTASDVQGLCLRTIAVDPTNPDFVVAAGDSTFVSTNGGTAWTQRTSLPSGSTVEAVAIDPGTPRHIYAGMEAGLFVSSDDGVTWMPALLTAGAVADVEVNPATHAVYAVTSSLVVRSTDFGASWVNATFDLPSTFETRIAVASAPDELYAGTYGAGSYAITIGALDGGSAFDAGTAMDGGMTTMDGGTTMTDGGTTMKDGGTTQNDGGTTMSDGGTLPDGGSPSPDGGVQPGDGGTRADGGDGNQIIGTCGCGSGPGSLIVLALVILTRRLRYRARSF